MSDIAARISRFHGGFEDPDGEYEIVSSLKKSVVHFDVQDSEEVTAVNDSEPSTFSADEALFYIKALWSLMALAMIAWLSYRWTASSKSESKDVKKKLESEGAKGKKNQEDSRIKSISVGKTTRTCSLETSEASLRVQNLSFQFEKVKGCKNKNNHSNSPMTQHQQYECVETTTLTRKEFEEVLVPEELLSSKEEAQLRRRHKSPKTPPTTRQRSPSPPPLDDEPWPDVPQLLPPPTRPPSNSLLQSSTTSLVQSTPSTPTSTKESLHYSSSSQSPSISNANSLAAIIQQSAVEQTPQKMAQSFRETIEIMEQEIVKSTVKIDSSRVAAELAMLHHSSQIQERQLLQKISFQARRQSSLVLEKYEDNLKHLPKTRGQCIDSIWSAISYSLWVCVLLEAGRHGSSLLNQLEYFSVRHVGDTLLEMACGCDEEEYYDDIDPQPPFSMVSTLAGFVFPGWEASLQDSASPLLVMARHFPCVLGYVGIWVIVMAVHSALTYMHFPSFLHQIFNISGLVMYLAQKPSAWLVVMDNLERYLLLAKVQLTMTITSFALAIWWDLGTRNYIAERQQLMQKAQNQGKDAETTMTMCQVGRKLAHFQDMALMFSLVPPVVTGLLVLWGV